MKIDLTGRKALVGGASAGLGKAIAMELADCGAEVTLAARNPEKLKKAQNELSTDAGQSHQILVVDYTDFEAYRRVMEPYFRENPIDILVNNTQGPLAGTIDDLTLKDYRKAFDLLFMVNCFNSMQVVKGMAERGWGRIINVSSSTVREPVDTLVLSNTMRTAWLSWCKSLSVFYADKGVTVNTILTGRFDTERIRSLTQKTADKSGVSFDEAMKSMLASLPAKRLGKTEEYGALAAFLASNNAAYINGAAIPLDGGMLKGL